MGFFTSRKTENTDIHLAVASATVEGEKSVVNAIRSRFIGKGKGKEREDAAPTFSQSLSVAETLSGTLPAATRTKQSTFLSKSSTVSLRAGPSSASLKSNAAREPNTSTLRKTKNPISPTDPTTSSASPRNSIDLRHAVPPARPRPSQPTSTQSRNSITTDSATATLAQRLNELASANAQGLLDDDEYRVLRQNLFERFASNAVVPTEAPVVPVTSPQPRITDPQGHGAPRPVSRPLSNFHVDVERPPSSASRNSGSFSVSSFVKRAASRRTGNGASKDYSETSSVFSTRSKSSTNFFRRGLSRKSSNGSVRTTTSRTQADTMSISSRQTALDSDRGLSDQTRSTYPSTPRSTTSNRRFQTPPSSFNHRLLETRHMPHASDVFDEDHPKSASELRQEILAVEAEARRLMDAFNGLEVTTLAKLQRQQQHGQAPFDEPTVHLDASSASHYDGRSVRRLDLDALSIRSGTSVGTSPSIKHLPTPTRKSRSKGTLNHTISLGSTGTSSLRRKDSSSSFGSQERLTPAGPRNKNLPPVPALPAAYGHLKLGSASNLSLSRSAHLPSMTSVPEDNSLTTMDSPTDTTANEMEDIRRRRAEVSRRYEARLEYLRARLKGAELHEKLARK